MKQFCFRRLGALALLGALLVPQASALSGVSSWAQKEVLVAQQTDLEPSSLSSLDAKSSVTRAEFCAIALNIYQHITGETVKLSNRTPFTDCKDKTVATAYELGLVSGKGNGTFDPNATIQRQDLCKMLENVLIALDIDADEIAGEASIEDFSDISSLKKYAYNATVTMVDHAVLFGVKNENGKSSLNPTGNASREQALVLALRFCDTFEDDYTPPKNTTKPSVPQEDDQVSVPEVPTTMPSTTAEKMVFVYGAGGEKYLTEAEARPNMTEIAVPVWRLSNGVKTPGTAYFSIHKNLASTVKKIFAEIYNGSEKFPIKDVGGYAWRASEEGNTKYEHPQGTAIDINWNENAYGYVSGGVFTPSTGSYWKPYIDPYSIPENGDVVRAFAKYGFSWGGNAWAQWGGTRDYMHFSFFGG